MQCNPCSFPQRPRAVRSGPAGGGKKEKERQRKERQRQRKMDEAWEALQAAIEAMLAGAKCVSPLRLMCIGRYSPFPWGGGGFYVRVAECTHVSCVAVWVWLQWGELAAGRGGGDGGGGEARGSQQRVAGSAGGGGEGHDTSKGMMLQARANPNPNPNPAGSE
jgi:hypothetical protein